MSKNNKKRSSKSRIPPDVAAQYFSHLSNSGGGDGTNRDPPCSPEEVKALMSMFAEIMGMAEKKSSVSFMFGSNNKNGGGSGGSSNSNVNSAENWPPSALAAAARAASMYMPPEDFLDYEDEDEEEDDEEEDEGDEDYEDDHHTDDSKRPAIDPNDWKDLEEVARDEKLEEELRQKKADKKREKKQRKKERLRKEAADKANEAAKKKQEKLVNSWKSRVVAACQAQEATKVAALLGESPFKKEEDAKDHVDFLLSSCVAKTREDVDSGSDCRLKLSEFVASVLFPSFFAISHKTGRSSLHAACFIGDHFFLQFVLKHGSNGEEEAKSHIDDLCEESGFAPIHYAVLSGSKEVLEILLEHGCKLYICTDEDETSLRGRGITALELAQLILSGELSDLDSNGSILDDLNDCFLSNVDDRRRYHDFLRLATSRLSDVSKNGYSPPLPVEAEEDEDEQLDSQQNKAAASRNKKKKKKKKQQQPATPAVAATTTPTPQIHQEDPMIAALRGMGFSDEQIEAAVEACGGTARATADDLVMWIFSQESGEAPPAPVAAVNEAPTAAAASQQVTPAPIMESSQESAARAERERIEALRLAEEGRLAQQRLTQKREEQRHRNREWNNREQARQKQAKASAPPPQYKARPGMLPPGQQPILGLQGPTPEQAAKARAMPNGMHQGSKNGVVALKRPAGPVKILSRSKVPPEVSTAAAFDVKRHPPGLETIGSDFSYVGGGSAFAEDATVSSLGSGIVGQNEWMNETDSVANSYVNDAPALTGFQGLGTNNVPPPGFQSGMMMQHAPEEAFMENEELGFLGDPNATGEIRATARAFVPTNFKTLPGLPSGPSNYQVPELSTIGESNAGMNPMSCLLPGGLAPYPVGQQHQAPLLNGFDRPTPATSYSPVQSAASSITGFSGADDMAAPPGVGLPPSLGLGAFQSSSAPMGSSLLNPLSLGTQGGSMQQPLWGGAPQPSLAGAPLGGLAPLSEGLPSLSAFGGAFGVTPLEDKANGAPATGGGGWGDTTTTTSSSIW